MAAARIIVDGPLVTLFGNTLVELTLLASELADQRMAEQACETGLAALRAATAARRERSPELVIVRDARDPGWWYLKSSQLGGSRRCRRFLGPARSSTRESFDAF